jgi:hypothetical protein
MAGDIRTDAMRMASAQFARIAPSSPFAAGF